MTVLKLAAGFGLTEDIKMFEVIYWNEQRETATLGNTWTLAGYK